MVRFSKKTDSALLALQHVASAGESGDVSARAIAERFDIPLELLAKILQRLARPTDCRTQRVDGSCRLARGRTR